MRVVGANVRIEGGAGPRLDRCTIDRGEQCGVLVQEGGRGVLSDCEMSCNKGAGCVGQLLLWHLM